MDAVHGARVRVVDRVAGRLGGTLTEFLKPHRAAIVRFADVAQPRFSNAIPDLWAEAFPMVVPPKEEDGLGIILLNSNADTHFSFTNALGMVSAEQMLAFDIVASAYPGAAFIVALMRHISDMSVSRNIAARVDKRARPAADGNGLIGFAIDAPENLAHVAVINSYNGGL